MWVILGFFASIFLSTMLFGFSLSALFDGIVSANPLGVVLLGLILATFLNYQYIHKPKMLRLKAQAIRRKEQMWTPAPLREIHEVREVRRVRIVFPGTTSEPSSSPGPKVPERVRRVSRLWKH